VDPVAVVLLLLVGLGGCGAAVAASPGVFGAPQVVGHIGRAVPFEARLAIASNGRAAVVWAESPTASGEAIDLATAPRGRRFSSPRTIARAPFGPIQLALAVSNAGDVTLALGPSSGGLEVLTQSSNGGMSRRQWIVRPPAVLIGMRTAVQSTGAALLAWTQMTSAGGPAVAGAAWRAAGTATFGRSLNLGRAAGWQVPQPVFLSAHRAAIGAVTVAPDGANPAAFTRLQVAFADVGQPFRAPTTVSTVARPHTITGASFAPDRAGGVFAAWTTVAATSPPTDGSVWAARVASRSTPLVRQRLAAGTIARLAGVVGTARERALVIWNSNGHGIHGAAVGPRFATTLGNDPPEGQSVTPAVAGSAAGTAVVTWAHDIKPPTTTDALGIQQVRYAIIPPAAHAFCISKSLGASTTDPQIAMDATGSGFILWTGARSAAGPIKVTRRSQDTATPRTCS
jgi:hypothetical protein